MKRNAVRIMFLAISLVTGIRSLQADTERGYDYFKKQDYEMAAAEFERVLGQGQEDAATREALGWCYYWLGRYDQAENEFNRALELNPGLTGALKGLAEVKKWRYLIFNKAWRLYYNKDYVNAITVFNSILKDTTGRLPASELWKVHSGIGWCNYYLQNYSAAEKEFRAILGVYKSNEYALKGLGFTLYQLGHYKDSIRVLETLLPLHPEWVDVQSMIGWDQYALKDYVSAGESFRKAVASNSILPDARYGLAWTLFQLNNKEAALEEFSRALELSPYHPSVYHLVEIIDADKDFWPLYKKLAWSYYEQKDYQSAEKYFTQAAIRISDDPDITRGLAFSRFKLGDYPAVISALKNLISENRDLPPVVEHGITSEGKEFTIRSNERTILAWCYYYQGRFDQAAELFQTELKAHPQWVDILTGLGWCALKQGEIEQAEQYLTKASRLNPHYTVVLMGLSELDKIKSTDFNAAWDAYYAGDYSAAMKRFESIAQSGMKDVSESDRWRVYSGLGWSALKLEKFSDAEQAFRKVLELSENNYYGLFGLAQCFYRSEDLSNALKYVDLTLEQNAEAADLWTLKGWILLDSGKRSKAAAAFRKAQSIQPENADVFAGLGWIALQSGKKQDAKDYFNSALKLDPGQAKALQGQEQLKKETQQ